MERVERERKWKGKGARAEKKGRENGKGENLKGRGARERRKKLCRIER